MYFNTNLTHIRKLKGLTQTEVAKIFSIGRSTWANYEIGTSKPSFELLTDIADFFEVSESDLIRRDLRKTTDLEELNPVKEKRDKLVQEAENEMNDIYVALIELQKEKIENLNKEIEDLKKELRTTKAIAAESKLKYQKK